MVLYFGDVPVGDPVSGEKIFRARAAQCHTTARGDMHGVGPNLWGIVGATAGGKLGFVYSKANSESEVVWSREALNEYLESPRKYMPGTRMAFAGLKKAQDRADVIAYLETLRS